MKDFLLKIYYTIIALLTKIYLKRTKPYIIGITGSVGKTSCRMIVSQVLTQLLPDKKIYTSPKNFNSEIGLILSILQIETYEPKLSVLGGLFFKIIFSIIRPKNVPDILVLEYGIDHLHDMKFLTLISKADIAIFTKLDAVHGENFTSLEAIGDEKFLLMKSARKRVYLNSLDEYCRAHTEEIKPEIRFYSQGTLEAQEVKYIIEGHDVYSVATSEFGEIKTNLLGQESMAYILMSLDIASFLSKDSIHEKEYFFQLTLQAGRYEIFSSDDNIFIDSTYNASPESMKMMIQNTKLLHDTLVPDYKVGFVLGDMRELGQNSESSHISLVPYLLDADFIFTVGTEMRTYVASELLKSNFKGLLKSFSSSREAGKELKVYLESRENKSIILFKGSQNTIFIEEALKEVLDNESDKKKLVRQETFWQEKKEVFFSKINNNKVN